MRIELSGRIEIDLAMHVPCLTSTLEVEPQAYGMLDAWRQVDRIATASSNCLCRYMMRTQSTPHHYGKLATDRHTVQRKRTAGVRQTRNGGRGALGIFFEQHHRASL
jgi:hypothetical protein